MTLVINAGTHLLSLMFCMANAMWSPPKLCFLGVVCLPRMAEKIILLISVLLPW